MYLSLVFILLISFAGAMLESASLQNVKNYRRADMTRAVESIFAEYQKELWEVYGIFALEGSYETGSYNEELLKERLAYYGASGMDQEITRIQLLTDQGASAFYEQVTAYMENKYGLDKVKKLVGQTDTWKAGEEALQNYERDGAKTEQELQELLSQKEELPEEENPLSHVAKLKSMPLVDLIMPKGRVMSKKSITLSEMVSHRKRNQGYGDFSDVAGSTICAPEMSKPPSAALFLTASSLPTSTSLAIPSFKILSAASRVLISSVSGSTIVLMLDFALSLITSINPMIKWLLSFVTVVLRVILPKPFE